MGVQQNGSEAVEVYEPQSLHDMTDREILIEVAANLRLVGDFIRQFQNMKPGDMMKMMLGR